MDYLILQRIKQYYKLSRYDEEGEQDERDFLGSQRQLLLLNLLLLLILLLILLLFLLLLLLSMLLLLSSQKLKFCQILQ